jgi:hypothetical protein
LKQSESSPQKELTDRTTKPDYEINEINEISPLRQSVEERVNSWTAPNADDLIVQWEALGCPQIPLSPGVAISSLRKWINSQIPEQLSVEHLAVVRRFLWEGLPLTEVLPADPLLEEWVRVSIPEWHRILQESVEQGDRRRAEYARWMLREILLDPDYEEPQP